MKNERKWISMGSVDVNYRIIGLNVHTHRHARSLTQEQLAEKSGVSKQFICNIECGRAIPSLKTLSRLLGHTSPNFSINTYTSQTADMQRDAAEAMNTMFEKLKIGD